MDDISVLKQRIADLELQLAAKKKKSARSRILEMSSEVVDSNPYSRLMALKRMGIVSNYEKIRDYSVVIVGLGGIGRSCDYMNCITINFIN